MGKDIPRSFSERKIRAANRSTTYFHECRGGQCGRRDYRKVPAPNHTFERQEGTSSITMPQPFRMGRDWSRVARRANTI